MDEFWVEDHRDGIFYCVHGLVHVSVFLKQIQCAFFDSAGAFDDVAFCRVVAEDEFAELEEAVDAFLVRVVVGPAVLGCDRGTPGLRDRGLVVLADLRGGKGVVVLFALEWKTSLGTRLSVFVLLTQVTLVAAVAHTQAVVGAVLPTSLAFKRRYPLFHLSIIVLGDSSESLWRGKEEGTEVGKRKRSREESEEEEKQKQKQKEE